MVRSILADAPRPDGMSTPPAAGDVEDRHLVGLPRCLDRRACSVRLILVVWVGNFDGSSNPAFVGVQAAAPLFFRIADAVRQSTPPQMDRLLLPPPGVLQVEVCAASGELPNADCPRRSARLVHSGQVADPREHRAPARAGGYAQRCSGPAPARRGSYVRDEVFEFWPSDIQRLFALAGMPRRRPPEDHCAGRRPVLVQDVPPVITSPLIGGTYQLRTAHGAGDMLQLNATAGAGVQVLYWFADGGFIGASRPSVALPWRPAHAGADQHQRGR